MARFIKYAIAVAIAVIVILCVLDWGMTVVHRRAEHRGVFARLRHSADRQYDFVVVGSSRVACNIDPAQIKEATGQSGLNLARLGCGSDEALLMTKLFFANGNRAKRMFFQVDYSWEETSPQKKPLASAMPFIRDELFREHYQDWEDFALLHNIPFYRYARYAPEIGFRETVMAVVGASVSVVESLGFSPVDGAFRGEEVFQVKLTSPANAKLEAVIEICRQNDCEPHFFTSPFFAVKGADFKAFLSPRLPNYRDFSGALPEEHWFRDVSHLNAAGAEEFTRLFIQAWFTG